MANIINISVFMYITVLVLGALNGFNLFGGAVSDVYNATAPASYVANSTTYNYTDPFAIVNSWNVAGVQGTYAIAAIFGAVGLMVAALGSYLAVAGMGLQVSWVVSALFPWIPSAFTTVIFAVSCMILLIAIIQFASGRSERLSR